jgi:hypothetical protein
VARIAQKTGMYKGKMPHVQKILDNARTLGLEQIGPCGDLAK